MMPCARIINFMLSVALTRILAMWIIYSILVSCPKKTTILILFFFISCFIFLKIAANAQPQNNDALEKACNQHSKGDSTCSLTGYV